MTGISKKLISFSLILAMLLSFSAVASAADTYTVSFVSEGGGLARTDKPFYSAGEVVTISAFAAEGFVFYGWVTSDVLINRTSEYSATFIMPAKDVKINAVFAIKQADVKETVSVTFDTNGGSELNTAYVESGTPVQEPAIIPSKTGYVFAGWYADTICTIPFDFSAPLYSSTIVYANWTPAPVVSPQKFSDVSKGDWFYQAVMALNEQNIVNGMSANSFAPNAPVTRAQFATILANMSGAQLSDTATPFADVKADAWHAKAVSWAYSNGIVTGTSETSFAPDALISRQDMAVMIKRYAEKIAKTDLPERTSASVFADSAEISGYAADAVSAMQIAGIITGKPGNIFAPKANALRSEACQMIYKFLDIIK